MPLRQNALNLWLKQCLDDKPFTLTPLAGDASFRRYFRLHREGITQVVMDAPPDKESIDAFINIGKALTTVGVHTPTVHAADRAQGFALLEDLGDHLFLNGLSPKNADARYTAAMSTLHTIARCATTPLMLPHFDTVFMQQELSLFRDWFLEKYLHIVLSAEDLQVLNSMAHQLTCEIMTQPQVFIHRDYHSRNLMILDESDPTDLGVIDFQDAMCGPFTYDLVSLLKDCYIQWPHQLVTDWLGYFYETLPDTNGWSLTQFTRGFDLCGIQRHLKVLGIFCRLSLRDNKPSYLRDLPLTFHYVMAALEQYDDYASFTQWMQRVVYPAFSTKHPS